MRQFPYDGGTFPDTQISEAGRRLIAQQLARLTERQLVALFTAARFPEFHGGRGPPRTRSDGRPCSSKKSGKSPRPDRVPPGPDIPIPHEHDD